MLQQKSASLHPEAGPTLSKAVVRAAGFLGFSQAAMAEVLCLSPSSVSRLFSGDYVLSPARRAEWQLGLMFGRLFRSLDSILGHGEQARTWLNGENTALGGRPADLVRSMEGINRVVAYLDSYRGRL